MSPAQIRNFCIILSSIFLAVLLLWIGLAPIGSSSEGREGQVVRSILRTGEYILPLRNGIVPSKPPLYHWISATISSVRDSSDEWSIRAPSALAASGILLLTLLLAAKLFGRYTTQPLLTFIAVVLATIYGFISMAGDARVDTVFSFFITLSIYAILSAYNPNDPLWHRRANFSLFFFAMGLAVLAKGPLGAVLPSVIVGSILWGASSFKDAVILMIRPRIGWLYLILLAAPFYLIAPLSVADGVKEEFVWRHFIYENIERFLGGDDIPREEWWFYITPFLGSAAPWSLGFIWLMAKRRTIKQPGLKAPINFGVIWFMSGFILFSLAAGKRHSYLLPLYPGMAIALGALYIARSSELVNRAKSFLIPKETALLAFSILALILIEAVRIPKLIDNPMIEFSRAWIISEALLCAEISFLVAIILAAVAKYRSTISLTSRQLALWAALLLLICPLLFIRIGVKNNLYQFETVAQQINSTIPKHASLIVVKYKREEHFDPIFYYLDREVTLHDAAKLELPKNTFILARHTWLQKFQSANEDLKVIERFRSNKVSDQAGGEREIVLFQLK